jgi:hypothetical protein
LLSLTPSPAKTPFTPPHAPPVAVTPVRYFRLPRFRPSLVATVHPYRAAHSSGIA